MAIAFPAEQFAHCVAGRHMPQRTVFELAVRADDRALAVALEPLQRHAHRAAQLLRHVDADRLQRLHHRKDVLHVAAGEQVGHDDADRTAAQRHGGHRAELVVDVFDVREDAADLDHRVAFAAMSWVSCMSTFVKQPPNQLAPAPQDARLARRGLHDVGTRARPNGPSPGVAKRTRTGPRLAAPAAPVRRRVAARRR